MTFYHLPNARTFDQAAEMDRLQQAGVCVFCPGHIGEALHRTDHWAVVVNRWPYDNAAVHLLLIPCLHVADLLDLPGDVRDDLWAALGWLRDGYGLASYGLAARCGDCAATGGTVRHLHLHVVVPEAGAKVRFTVG